VQLVAAIFSENPYRTNEAERHDGPAVLRGILLDHHPNGTLEAALRSPKPQMDERWRIWAFQIARALARLHRSDIMHMDLESSNIAIDADENAVLIDVSGIGGVTQKWLSPEMSDLPDPWSQRAEPRKRCDVWALGAIFLMMAAATSDDEETQVLGDLARRATAEAPFRISLGDVISALCAEPVLV